MLSSSSWRSTPHSLTCAPTTLSSNGICESQAAPLLTHAETEFADHARFPHRHRERQKLKTRDEAWKKLRDSALVNSKIIGAVAPKNLTDEQLAPRSSTTELLSLSDTDSIGSIGDMTGDEEEGTARGAGSSFLEGIGSGLNKNGGGAAIGADVSGHSDFEYAGQDDEHETGPASTRSGPSTPRGNNDQVDDMKKFPETLRSNVAAAKGAESPHVRRKSAIPMDPTVLQELSHHKSLDEAK